MARREKQKATFEWEEDDEDEDSGLGVGTSKEGMNNLRSESVNSSDDEEANEDLSLKIVEKALLMRAAKLTWSPANDDDVSENDGGKVMEGGNVDEEKDQGVSKDDVVKKEKKLKKKKKKKEEKVMVVEKVEVEEQSLVDVNEAEKTGATKQTDSLESLDPNNVEITDNIILRKLLRGPRYFDPPDNSWGTCFNCGGEGHRAVNCTAEKRKKPCFVCGSFDHNARQCSKAKDCFICKKGGHRAKDCPEKWKAGPQASKICLKCGNAGHDMFFCENDYSPEDLKDIQCYICKGFGHLCCVGSVESKGSQLSCYKCGHLGHTGLACGNAHEGSTGEVTPSSCYKCGEEGHFARECKSLAKKKKRKPKPSTPAGKNLKEDKSYKGCKSEPSNFQKSSKRRKFQEDGNLSTPNKSKHRGGWITDDPGDISFEKFNKRSWRSPATPYNNSHMISPSNYNPSWRSPATPYNNSHMISPSNYNPSWRSPATPYNNSHMTSPSNYNSWSSQSYGNFQYGGSSSQATAPGFQHRFSASRFTNSRSDSYSRNYNW